MRGMIVVLALLTSPAFAQVMCDQTGNMTSCNGQLQQQQNSGITNWLPYQKSMQQYQAEALANQQAITQRRQAEQQLEEAQAQGRRNQELYEQQMAMLQQQQAQAQADNATNKEVGATAKSGVSSRFNTVPGYIAGGRDDPRMLPYLNGAGNALLFANIELHARNQPPLYCLPNALQLNAENYQQIVDKTIADMSEEMKHSSEQYPIEFILLVGLKSTFPCAPPAAAPRHRK